MIVLEKKIVLLKRLNNFTYFFVLCELSISTARRVNTISKAMRNISVLPRNDGVLSR